MCVLPSDLVDVMSVREFLLSVGVQQHNLPRFAPLIAKDVKPLVELDESLNSLTILTEDCDVCESPLYSSTDVVPLFNKDTGDLVGYRIENALDVLTKRLQGE